MTRYRFGDLFVESEVTLPSLPIASDGPAEALVRRDRSGPSGSDTTWDHVWKTPDGAVSLSCTRTENGYRLRVPDLGEFDVLGEGTEVACRAHDDLPEATLEHLLLDQVLPRVLAWRGRSVLHAGCVASAEGAIAFLGESGMGKSTLCAAFARAGWTLLGDDAIVVAPSAEGGFEVLPTYPGLRLLGESRRRLASGAESSPVAHTTEKRRIAWRAPEPGWRPLRALYVLENARDRERSPRVGTVRGNEALLTLVRASFQLHLHDDERTRALFHRLAALADRVPILRLAYPRAFELLPRVIEAVESRRYDPTGLQKRAQSLIA